MNTKEFAKQIRKDLKITFPTYKFSITSDCKSIRVVLMKSDIDFGIDPQRGYESVNHYHVANNYTGEQKQVLGVIADLLLRDQKEVVYDGDYGSVPNYYVTMAIGKWNKPYELIE